MATYIAILLFAANPSHGHFADGGIRDPNGQSFAQLAKAAASANPPGYSITGKTDHRVGHAQRAFDAFARYSRPVNVQYARCHVGRMYEQLRQWDYLRQTEPTQHDHLTSTELAEFKAACYVMLKAPEAATRDQALRHLTVVANHDDARPLLALLRDPNLPRDLVCIAIGRTGSEAALPVLERELGGPADEQARAAIDNIKAMAAAEH